MFRVNFDCKKLGLVDFGGKVVLVDFDWKNWGLTGKTSILRFPARGGLVGQNEKCKKVAQFLGETFGADGFPPKSPPSSGKLRVSVFSPEFL